MERQIVDLSQFRSEDPPVRTVMFRGTEPQTVGGFNFGADSSTGVTEAPGDKTPKAGGPSTAHQGEAGVLDVLFVSAHFNVDNPECVCCVCVVCGVCACLYVCVWCVCVCVCVVCVCVCVVCMCVCVRVCCVCVCVCSCGCVCVLLRAYACVRARVRLCVRECTRAHVSACMRACVRLRDLGRIKLALKSAG